MPKEIDGKLPLPMCWWLRHESARLNATRTRRPGEAIPAKLALAAKPAEERSARALRLGSNFVPLEWRHSRGPADRFGTQEDVR